MGQYTAEMEYLSDDGEIGFVVEGRASTPEGAIKALAMAYCRDSRGRAASLLRVAVGQLEAAKGIHPHF